jgi:adenylosuccinate lyase
MIPRYTRPQMARIWEADNRYRIWLEIEILAAEAMAELGTVPKDVPAPPGAMTYTSILGGVALALQ